jgi:hypothetical protein
MELRFDVPGWPIGLAAGNNANFTDVCFAAGPEPVFFASAAQVTTPEPLVALDLDFDAVPSALEPPRSSSFGGTLVAIGLAAIGFGLLLVPVRRRA